MIKILETLGIYIYNKPRADIILNGDTLRALPLKSGARQGRISTTPSHLI